MVFVFVLVFACVCFAVRLVVVVSVVLIVLVLMVRCDNERRLGGLVLRIAGTNKHDSVGFPFFSLFAVSIKQWCSLSSLCVFSFFLSHLLSLLIRFTFQLIIQLFFGCVGGGAGAMVRCDL